MVRIYRFVFMMSFFAVSMASAMEEGERPASIGTHPLSASQEVIDIALVGGGLSGLKASLELHKRRENYALFEARNRLGGRTYSEIHEEYVLNMGGGVDRF